MPPMPGKASSGTPPSAPSRVEDELHGVEQVAVPACRAAARASRRSRAEEKYVAYRSRASRSRARPRRRRDLAEQRVAVLGDEPEQQAVDEAEQRAVEVGQRRGRSAVEPGRVAAGWPGARGSRCRGSRSPA